MSQIGLLKTRRFSALFWTQFLGAFNDNLFKNSLILLITYQGLHVWGLPPEQMVAASGGLFILPFFLFSASAGQIADKMEKRLVTLYIKLAEIVFMGIAVWGFVKQNPHLLLLVLILMGVHSTFFGPIKYSILPELLDESELVGGNALVEAGTFVSILLGTIASGFLVSIDKEGTSLVAAAPVFVAILGYVASLFIPRTPAAAPNLHIDLNPLRPTREMYHYTKQSRAVYLSVLGISWFWFFGAAVLSLIPAYCKDALHTGERVATFFMAIFSLGIAIGSMLCGKLSRRTLELGLVPLGSFGISFFVLTLSLVKPPPVEGDLANLFQFIGMPGSVPIVISMLGFSLFSGFFIVPLYTLLQERTDRTQRSRVIAGNNIVNAVFMVVAAIYLLVILRMGFSIRQVFFSLAVLNALVATYIYTVLPDFFYRFILWATANIMYRLKIKGADEIPNTGAALVVCNHVTFVDWMILAAGFHRPLRFVMDHTFYRGWLVKRMLDRAGAIPIAKKTESIEIRERAFQQISEALRAGELVCIFPEGHLTHDGEMDQFRPGVEKILARDAVPVVPVALVGMWGSFFSRERGRAIFKWPHRFWSRVELRIGPSLGPETLSAKVLQEKIQALLN